MRASVRDGDHSDLDHVQCLSADVYLDDVLQTMCTMADDQLGVIERIVTDAAGVVVTDPLSNGPAVETVSGVVRIECPRFE